MKRNLMPCPHCGGKVNASYMGSSDWEVFHVVDDNHQIDVHCVDAVLCSKRTKTQNALTEGAE